MIKITSLILLILFLIGCTNEEQSLNIHKPDITLNVYASSNIVYLNKIVIFSIKVANKGQKESKSITVVNTLPVHLEYINSNHNGKFVPCNGDKLATITWTIDTLEAGKQQKLEITARVILEGGTVANKVQLQAGEKIIEDSVSIRLLGVPMSHNSTYDTEDPVEIGGTTMYVIPMRNEGINDVTNIILVNQLPEEMEFVNAESPTAFIYVHDKHCVIFEPYPKLEPDKQLQYKIICKAIRVGSAKNTARIRYDQFEKEIIDEEGTSIYE